MVQFTEMKPFFKSRITFFISFAIFLIFNFLLFQNCSTDSLLSIGSNARKNNEHTQGVSAEKNPDALSALENGEGGNGGGFDGKPFVHIGSCGGGSKTEVISRIIRLESIQQTKPIKYSINREKCKTLETPLLVTADQIFDAAPTYLIYNENIYVPETKFAEGNLDWSPKRGNLVSYFSFKTNASDMVTGIPFRENGQIQFGPEFLIENSPAGFFNGLNTFLVSQPFGSLADRRYHLTKFTFSAWIIPKELEKQNNKMIFARFPDSRYINNYAFGILRGGLPDAGKPYVQFFTSGGLSSTVVGARTLLENEPVHLLGSYDGRNLSLFVDGALSASKNTTDIPYTNFDFPAVIGAFNDQGEDIFSGLIGQLGIWNEGLSENEVSALYKKQLFDKK